MTDELSSLSESDADPGGLLLKSAKRYRLSEARRNAALAAAGLAGTALSGSSTASGSSLLFKPLTAAVLGGAVLAAGGVLIGLQGSDDLRPGAPAPVADASTSVTKPHVAVPRAPASDTPRLQLEHTAPQLAPTRPPPASARAPRARDQGPDISAELALLDGASRALASGNASIALDVLERYDHEHPRGALRLEAAVLRVEALAASGQTEPATQRASELLRRHPQSPLAPRLRSLIAASQARR
jgi:TolA-binding protein